MALVLGYLKAKTHALNHDVGFNDPLTDKNSAKNDNLKKLVLSFLLTLL